MSPLGILFAPANFFDLRRFPIHAGNPNLADDDKAQSLEQLKVLAEAGQNPNNETAQKQAKKAMGFLKVIAEGLPSAATLVVACKEILPVSAHFFGL